ncbi:hypothetical protein AC579_3020 [Pseudocercospora musae]|uniref:Uncharacterized protein n=1 Tax=Pseudocercospora musae TaxID=113226 RepID=A0A139I4N7_9PEZI|nr:hypothetical protein AC579_3020 [Pseudocercospora musae]
MDALFLFLVILEYYMLHTIIVAVLRGVYNNFINLNQQMHGGKHQRDFDDVGGDSSMVSQNRDTPPNMPAERSSNNSNIITRGRTSSSSATTIFLLPLQSITIDTTAAKKQHCKVAYGEFASAA